MAGGWSGEARLRILRLSGTRQLVMSYLRLRATRHWSTVQTSAPMGRCSPQDRTTERPGSGMLRQVIYETRAILRGHTQVVWGAVFSPDGARVVTVSNDFTGRLWDPKTGAAGPVLKGHAGWVTRAAFSADGKRIITTSWDQTARIWDAGTGTELAVLRGHNAALFDAVFSPDGKWALTSAYDGTARLWFVEGSTTVNTITDHTANVFNVQFSPDGARIVTGSSDGVRVAAADTGRNLLTIREKKGGPQSFRLKSRWHAHPDHVI